jgi:hypothetical protein
MLFMSDEALELKSLVAKWIVDHTQEAERSACGSKFEIPF